MNKFQPENIQSIDITQTVKLNGNKITLYNTKLSQDMDGIILSGIMPIKINEQTFKFQFNLFISDGRPMTKAMKWIGNTYTKDSGLGYPEKIEIVFDETGNIVDLLGENSTTGFEASGRPCSICEGNPCECPSAR